MIRLLGNPGPGKVTARLRLARLLRNLTALWLRKHPEQILFSCPLFCPGGFSLRTAVFARAIVAIQPLSRAEGVRVYSRPRLSSSFNEFWKKSPEGVDKANSCGNIHGL